MTNIYDFIVIGAGISGCTFASSLNKRFPDASILLIEYGRRLGGRSTTRKSRKNRILEFDHGLPSISFSKNISEDIFSLISPLIESQKLIDISQDILSINEFGIMDHQFTNNKIYRSIPFMKCFCEDIIKQSINPKKINFLFQTIIKTIIRNNDLWKVKDNHGRFLKSRNLIISSSLIAHPRCLKILKINSLPLIDAFTQGKDKIVDSLLIQTRKQEYIKRKNFILHISNLELVKNFQHKYLQVCFSKAIHSNYNFERIIFQIQSDSSMIIVLHCSYIDNMININIDSLINSLILIFISHKNFVDLFLHATLIDQMHWRASQPFNNLVSKELQWSSKNKIGFCGDWFDLNCCMGAESAMNSSIRLAKLLK